MPITASRLSKQPVQLIPMEDGWICRILPSDPPEPTEAEREAARLADRIYNDELQKKYDLTDADLEFLTDARGFPKPRLIDTGTVFPKIKAYRSRAAIAQWREQFLATADKFRR